MKKIKIEDKIFILTIGLILIGGLIGTFIRPLKINNIENRYAYQIPSFNVKEFLNGSYQESFERALSDQIPFSDKMKLFIKSLNLDAKIKYYRYQNTDDYHLLDDGIYLFRNSLVFAPTDFNYAKPYLEQKISNLNDIKKRLFKTSFYLYYIEKDFDLNFSSNTKIPFYEYIEKNIEPNIKIKNFKVNSFDDYQMYFYQTDHHWNYKGSYKGYLDIADLLNLTDLIESKKEICLNNHFVGSKAITLGNPFYFKERLCGYLYDLPNHLIYINNQLIDYYTNRSECYQPDSIIKYSDFYGYDYGLVEFDYNQPQKENLLIIGTSFDNPINELLATHYNKTYKVDLRYYEKEIGYKFDIVKFIQKYSIDDVLIIGDLGFFLDENFIIKGDE